MADLLSKDKNLNWGAGVDWADEDEIIDYQKPQEYTTPEGLKVTVQYKTNEQGEMVKVTKKVRQRLVREKVNHAVAERKKWEKFGQEKGKPPGPDKDTTIVGEVIFLKLILGGRAVQEEPDEDAKLKEQLKGKKILCRICKGGHFTTKCPFKDTLKPLDELEAPASPGDTGAAASPGASAASGGLQKAPSTGRYVPPSARLGAAGDKREGERMGSRPERDDSNTVRVTNLSEDTRESDVHELFRPFGQIARVFLSRDRETNRCKGFAFVSFIMKEDAAKAIASIDGHGYDNLILRCEWAKSDKN